MPRVISATENETVLASFKRERRRRDRSKSRSEKESLLQINFYIPERGKERKGKKFIIGSP